MTEFPTGLGAVIKGSWAYGDSSYGKRTFTLVGPERWSFIRGDLMSRSEHIDITNQYLISDIEVLSEGYTPPTEEPKKFGAVVEDAKGNFFWRTREFHLASWYGHEGGYFRWEYITQPVTVHFEGAEWSP